MESIKNFYNGKTLFVTGATGFLGKVLVEKLLRSCDGIERIYILIRKKRSKTAEQRAKDYCSDPIFRFNGLNETIICQKIEPIFGDILLPELGITEEDRKRLIGSVNVVIHLAAIVKLNAPLKPLVDRNLKPIKEVIGLCRQIERLDCLVYASTIATLIGTGCKSEVVANDVAVSPEFLINACDNWDDKHLKKMRQYLFHNYLNSYCISKALCEKALLAESDRFNIVIIRPSAVLPAYKEPAMGFVSGKQIIGNALLIGLGIMQVIPPLSGGHQCFIPVDYVVNSIIASVWYAGNQKSPQLQVYNLTSTYETGVSVKQLFTKIQTLSKKYPSKRVIRCSHLTIASNKTEFKIKNFYFHFVFAFLYDLIVKLIGREPRLYRTMKTMNKNFKDMEAFINNSPHYEVCNTFSLIERMSESDRKEFDFDVRNIEWNKYCEHIWLGIRRYLLMEKDTNITYATLKYQNLVKRTLIINSALIVIFVLLITIIFRAIF